jgi:hypothetical protein
MNQITINHAENSDDEDDDDGDDGEESKTAKKENQKAEDAKRQLILSHCKFFRLHGTPYVGFIHPQVQPHEEIIEEEFIMIETKDKARLSLHLGLLNRELGGVFLQQKKIGWLAGYVGELSQRGREEGNGKPRARSYSQHSVTVYADKAGVWEVPWATGIPARKGWKETAYFVPTVCQRRMDVSLKPPEKGFPRIHETVRLFSPPAGAHAARLFFAFICTLHAPSVVSPGVLAIGKSRTGKSTLARLVQGIFESRWGVMEKLNTVDIRDDRDLDAASVMYAVIPGDNKSNTFDDDILNKICGMIVGQTEGRRKYHTNTDMSINEATRPVLLTSLDPPKGREDFYERMLVFAFKEWTGKIADEELDARVNSSLPALRRECIEVGRQIELQKHGTGLPPVSLPGWTLFGWSRAASFAYELLGLRKEVFIADMGEMLSVRSKERGEATPFVRYLSAYIQDFIASHVESFESQSSQDPYVSKQDSDERTIYTLRATAHMWLEKITEKGRKLEGFGVKGLPTSPQEFRSRLEVNAEELGRNGIVCTEQLKSWRDPRLKNKVVRIWGFTYADAARDPKESPELSVQPEPPPEVVPS